MCSRIAERLLTTGDIGSPASKLKEQFKPLAQFMELAHERWWYGEQENCPLEEKFDKKEKEDHFKARPLR